MREYFTLLNSSRIFSVIIIFIMNIGSKYMMQDIPVAVDIFFENFWARMIVVFCVAFVSTHDIFMSLVITLLFIFLFTFILNENSKSCVLKRTINDYKSKKISDQDVSNAYRVINDYKQQKELINNPQIDTNSIENNNIFI